MLREKKGQLDCAQVDKNKWAVTLCVAKFIYTTHTHKTKTELWQ